MYSKCGVSPRMTQPRHTTASKRPLSAARCAASGISKAPGTRIVATSPASTPAAASAAIAPERRRSVTKSLNFATTMAMRRFFGGRSLGMAPAATCP
jgi:hypothetical protein